MKMISSAFFFSLLAAASCSAAFVAGLDGTSVQSTFGSGNVTTGTTAGLPSGWSVISGTGRVFNDLNNWALIAASGNTSQYSVQFNTGVPLSAGTIYSLGVDIGFYTTPPASASNNGWRVEFGTLDGTTFTALASGTGSATYAGHLHDGVYSDSALVEFTTGSAVADGNVVVRLTRTTTGPTNWMGFDNVVLNATAVPEPSAAMLGVLGALAAATRRKR